MSSGVELTHSTNNELQRLKQLLRSMEDEQLNIKCDQIISAMGGIRNVLMDRIGTDEDDGSNILTATQIEQLLRILPTETPQSVPSVPVTIEMDNTEIEPQIQKQLTLNVQRQQKKFVVYLNEQHDIWHWILPEDKQELAEKIVDFTLHSKWVLVYITFLFISAFVCRFFIPILQFIPASLAVLYATASFFTFNIDMTKRMLKSFILWFKMYNWIVAISGYIMIFNVDWVVEGMNWVAGTMIVVGISLHDGYRLNKKLKILMCFMVCALALGIYGFVFLEGDSQLFGGTYVFEDKIFTFLGQSVSTKSTCLNALFNLLIFMSGQLAKMISKEYRENATVLAVRPKIIWVDNWTEMNSNLANNSQFNIIDLQQDS
eukprot:504425_1